MQDYTLRAAALLNTTIYFVALDSEGACKEAGEMNMEGKEYVVTDGDIMHFRFNV